ncbi:hypothetical protein ACWGDE_06490 [Streptomyces sp. NPDC054956]
MTDRERVPADHRDPQTWYARGMVLLALGALLRLVVWANRPPQPWLLLDFLDGLGYALLASGALLFALGVVLRVVLRVARRRR